ncbi:MAG: hypothetical protein F6K31_35100 [Symploca sp. SIO2G7]|nr:hypothetical protein [Symploca sp. SIO2G7]
MSTSVIFNSTSNSKLYLTQVPNNGFCAFLLAENSAYKQSTISLEQSWQEQGGFYLFAQDNPTNIDAFLSKLRTYLKTATESYQSYMQVAIAWLSAPNNSNFNNENVRLLPFQKTTPGKYAVINDHNINFGNNYATLFIE